MAPRWWSLLVVCVAICRFLDALPIEPELLSAEQETLANQEKSIFGVQPEIDDSERHLVRDKRTIGILRTLFPSLSQIIDRKIQAITRFLFRVIGRLVLRGGGGGGTGTTASGDNGRRISITLPTFPPSTEDEETETESTTDSTVDADTTGDTSGDSTTQGGTSEETTPTDGASTSGGTTGGASTSGHPSDTENTVSSTLMRRRRQADEVEEEDDDQAAEATGDNELSEVVDESEDEAEEQAAEGTEDDPRNKRLVNFGIGASAGTGGSAGGSGNFLFDIIRLVAGSGTSQAQDEAENAPVEDGNVTASGKDDGYSAGVPGPLTRLFVIANRGIANLIQDLILRLAQTSERIVNFKARLITSII